VQLCAAARFVPRLWLLATCQRTRSPHVPLQVINLHDTDDRIELNAKALKWVLQQVRANVLLPAMVGGRHEFATDFRCQLCRSRRT